MAGKDALRNLPLLDPPRPDWTTEWDELMHKSANWLRTKLDRTRRLREHVNYLEDNGVYLWNLPPGSVVDLGPGGGELLEIAHACGHAAVGIDADSGDGGMGDDYLQACQLLHERQGLTVHYCGLAPILVSEELAYRQLVGVMRKCWLLNSRGSFEQMFAKHMDGDPHHLHHDAQRLSWRLDDANLHAFGLFFDLAQSLLQPGGHLLLHCNGSHNHAPMEFILREYAKRAGCKEFSRNPKPRVLHWLMD
jgi:hypothetical protein